MQKLARTNLRISQRQNAHERMRKLAEKRKRKDLRFETVEWNRERLSLVRAHKAARREDWNLGPIAPRRDIGEDAEKYGTVGRRQLNGVNKPGAEKKDWGIRVGDRVCVVGRTERDLGRIGEVGEVREAAGEVLVKGVNLVDVARRAHEGLSDRNRTPTRATEFPLPLSSVRLIYPLPHSTTGALTDTIVRSLIVANDKRYIDGTETRIPWPEPPAPPEKPEYEVDTLRIDVEEETWIPQLLKEPLPPGVVDELRGKYSSFRTRHEKDFMEKLEVREADEKRRKEVDPLKMMTPMQEWALVKKREAEGKQEPKLDESMLERIGKVMAKNKSLAFADTEARGAQEAKV